MKVDSGDILFAPFFPENSVALLEGPPRECVKGQPLLPDKRNTAGSFQMKVSLLEVTKLPPSWPRRTKGEGTIALLALAAKVLEHRHCCSSSSCLTQSLTFLC